MKGKQEVRTANLITYRIPTEQKDLGNLLHGSVETDIDIEEEATNEVDDGENNDYKMDNS